VRRIIQAHLTQELQLSQEHCGKSLKVFAVGYSYTVPLRMFSLRQHNWECVYQRAMDRLQELTAAAQGYKASLDRVKRYSDANFFVLEAITQTDQDLVGALGAIYECKFRTWPIFQCPEAHYKCPLRFLC
jgi:hypothetical protein